jgi:hypothetical protein
MTDERLHNWMADQFREIKELISDQRKELAAHVREDAENLGDLQEKLGTLRGGVLAGAFAITAFLSLLQLFLTRG